MYFFFMIGRQRYKLNGGTWLQMTPELQNPRLALIRIAVFLVSLKNSDEGDGAQGILGDTLSQVVPLPPEINCGSSSMDFALGICLT